MNALAAAGLALPTLVLVPALHRVVAATGPSESEPESEPETSEPESAPAACEAEPASPGADPVAPVAQVAPGSGPAGEVVTPPAEPADRPASHRRPARGPGLVAPGLVAQGLATAAVAVALAVALRAHPWWLPAYLYLGAVGVALAIIDVRVHRLPDALTLPSYPVLAALFGLAAAFDGGADRWVRAITAGGVVWLAFLGLWALPGGGLGFGDVKLSGLLGAALGWLGWTRVLAGFGIGMVLAGLVAAGLLLAGRAGRSTRIAYGPFLLAGTFAAVLLAHPT